jgi:hypothetical protein
LLSRFSFDHLAGRGCPCCDCRPQRRSGALV